MSTCPENDIHSIYLDNELPENFKAEYEAHIASCPKCKAKLEQMRKTHEAFQYDSESLELDKEFMDASFERLQSRMRYAKVASENKSSNTIMFPAPKKLLPFAIAAAAVVAYVVPAAFRTRAVSSDPSALAQVQTIKRTSDFSLDQNSILAEVTNNAYPLQLATNTNYGETNYTLSSFTPNLEASATPVSQRTAKNNSSASNLLADDFFSPSFTQQNNSELQVYMPTYVDFSSLGE